MSTNGKGKTKPKAKRKIGRPHKAQPERIAAILGDISQFGMTEEQACAHNDVNVTTWCDWKKLPEFADLRAKAQARRIIVLQTQMLDAMAKKLDWRAIAWQMERIFKEQFADPNKVALQLNQQIHQGNTAN